MEEQQSRMIPNSYPSPNYLVDVIMRLLSGNEQKCVDVICRKTFGWHKRSDRISKSQLIKITGLGSVTVDDCMSELVKFKIVTRVSESVKNQGVEWSIQHNDRYIDLQGLQDRDARRREKNHKKTEKANENKKVGMSNVPPKGRDVQHTPSRDVQHTPQKTLSKDNRSTASAGHPVFDFYETEFEKIKPHMKAKLTDAITIYSQSWVLDALKEAVTYSKKSWPYAEAILKRWMRDGQVKTKGDKNANTTNRSGDAKYQSKRVNPATRRAAESVINGRK